MNMLIADSGSTKTEWRLVKNEEVVAKVHTIGYNPYYADTPSIVASLRSLLLPALPEGGQPDSVYFYGSGCTGPAVNQIIVDAMQAIFPAVQHIEVASDMVGAARAACGHQPGLVCILGTGSNAAVYDGHTIISQSRALGFWLGDEGGGAYLGRQLAVQFLHGLLPNELAEAFRQEFSIDRLTVLDNAYHQPFPNRYFSRFTPFLSANSRHPYVDMLISEAFSAFLRLYVHPYPESKSGPVHFVGSVARYFEPQLKQAVLAGQYQLGRLVQSPIEELVSYHQTHRQNSGLV